MFHHAVMDTDDLTRADELAKTDHRCVTERRDGRHSQPLECTHAILTRDRGSAERDQIIGQDDRGSFAQPIRLRLARDILERDDHLPARRLRVCAGGGSCTQEDEERCADQAVGSARRK
jgi:hypothetical protein